MRRLLIATIGLILAFASSSDGQPAARHVLILYSSDLGFSTDAAFARAFRAQLSAQLHEPISFFEVSVQPMPSTEPVQDEVVANYLRASLAGRRLDLVVTSSAPAARFARRYREQLFPETPILLAAVDQRWMQHEVLTRNEAAVTVAIEPARVRVEDIRRLLPQTTNLFVVLGESPLERAWRDELIREFQPFTDRLTVAFFNQLSFADMMRRSAALPANSAIFYVVLSLDAEGVTHTEDRVLADLHAVASAPMFGAFSSQLGRGVVGGPVLDLESVAQHTVKAAVRLMRGESAATVQTAVQAVNRSMYDWRELQRWGISESRLPSGSLVQFRPASVWDLYRSYIMGAAAIVAFQSALIAGLIIQRVRRRRMELALRESERHLRRSYEQNQDLAGRLINAQEEERTRLARDLHDDVSQQLAGLSIMLSGLKRKIAGPAAQPEIESTVATLQDRTSAIARSIRGLSHELHPSVLEQAGLKATLRGHCANAEQLHHLAVTFTPHGDVDTIPTDVAICLFRVAQEALANAVRHAHARSILVQLTATSEGAELHVADDGVGFVKGERMGRGLGLRSIHERVRLVHGQVIVDSQPGHGTSLRVRIPRATPEYESARAS